MIVFFIAPDKALKNKDIKYLKNATKYFIYDRFRRCSAIFRRDSFKYYTMECNAMLEQYNQMNAFNKAIVFGYMY